MLARVVSAQLGFPAPVSWAQRLALPPGPPMQAPRRRRAFDSWVTFLTISSEVWHGAAQGATAADAAALAREAHRRLAA